VEEVQEGQGWRSLRFRNFCEGEARQFFLTVVILIVALSALQIREFGFGVRNSWILRAWHCRLFTQVVELAAT
jgi:hypothetical protein